MVVAMSAAANVFQSLLIGDLLLLVSFTAPALMPCRRIGGAAERDSSSNAPVACGDAADECSSSGLCFMIS
jgi:hypothetical protein